MGRPYCSLGVFGCGLALLVASNPVLANTDTGITTIPALDARVQYDGRVVRTDSSVQFDWVGVGARISVQGGTWVTASFRTQPGKRGTRFRVYASDQGFERYPMATVWVAPSPFAPNDAVNVTLFSGFSGNRDIALYNIVPPQYNTGVTSLISFSSDGKFAPAPAPARRMEFVGDSITAATNVERPQGAPSCGDGGLQSDWSQTYEARLCAAFGARCSTIAVGGKCMVRSCGGLQMPDYMPAAMYGDAPRATYAFPRAEAPDAMVINLGTNDYARGAQGAAYDELFARTTLAFMQNATQRYARGDIQFFLPTGPMTSASKNGTLQALQLAKAAGLKATWVDMTQACTALPWDAGNPDGCDGCASHPGVEGHRKMFEAAQPVIAQVMGWI
eukprot:g7966.t1